MKFGTDPRHEFKNWAQYNDHAPDKQGVDLLVEQNDQDGFKLLAPYASADPRYSVQVHGEGEYGRFVQATRTLFRGKIITRQISPSQMADAIRADPNWQSRSNKDIRLIACCTGRLNATDRGFAALLSKELGVNVSSPNVDIVGTPYRQGRNIGVNWSLERHPYSNFTGEKKWNYFTPNGD